MRRLHKLRKPAAGAGEITRVGNRTECALLQLTSDLGGDIEGLRKGRRSLRTFPFSSERKRSSTIVSGAPRCCFRRAPAANVVDSHCQTSRCSSISEVHEAQVQSAQAHGLHLWLWGECSDHRLLAATAARARQRC